MSDVAVVVLNYKCSCIKKRMWSLVAIFQRIFMLLSGQPTRREVSMLRDNYLMAIKLISEFCRPGILSRSQSVRLGFYLASSWFYFRSSKRSFLTKTNKTSILPYTDFSYIHYFVHLTITTHTLATKGPGSAHTCCYGHWKLFSRWTIQCEYLTC